MHAFVQKPAVYVLALLPSLHCAFHAMDKNKGAPFCLVLYLVAQHRNALSPKLGVQIDENNGYFYFYTVVMIIIIDKVSSCFLSVISLACCSIIIFCSLQAERLAARVTRVWDDFSDCCLLWICCKVIISSTSIDVTSTRN
jgi:hypothetical protein